MRVRVQLMVRINGIDYMKERINVKKIPLYSGSFFLGEKDINI